MGHVTDITGVAPPTPGAWKTEVDGGMVVEYDVPIETDDGMVLRADVFRPNRPGRFPVLLSYGPYGKWLAFQDGYKSAWDLMVARYPDVSRGTSNKYQNWEVVDPEKWVPDGYVCVRVDSRGAGRSPGVIALQSMRETRDMCVCIEWAGTRDWSNGKVGLSGISYYAINQWKAAAMRPPHLAAICVWEGLQDNYRETARHGGILCSWVKSWTEMQVRTVQHGLGQNGPRSALTGEWACGPETLSEAELAANRVDSWAEFQKHPFFDDAYKAATPDPARIEAPLLSAGNWGGQAGHLRGNIEGFLAAGSNQKWLEIHGGEHWTSYYTDYGVALQKRFFDRFLKGEDNGWDEQPRVQLQVRHPGERFVLRHESEWPLARTQWTRFYLDAQDMKLALSPPTAPQSVSFEALGDGLTFRSDPFLEETEITGPLAVELRISSSTADADLFLVLHLFDPDGREVLFQGALDPNTSIGKGWLRASRRKLDPERSAFYRPYHTHDEDQPLTPNEPVDVKVEVWPTCIVAPKGYRLGLSILGCDYLQDGPGSALSNMKYPLRGCGPYVHDVPEDRLPEVFGGRTTVHIGEVEPSFLLAPIIPAKGTSNDR